MGKRIKRKIENIWDLPGIGAATAYKLENTGYGKLEVVATASTDELASLNFIGRKTAQKLLKQLVR